MRSLCFIISLFFLAAQANVIVLPSNNSQNIAVPDSPYFRLWGGDFFSGQHLAPLTPGLLNLTHAQGQVRPTPVFWNLRRTLLIV